jgi:hypothetical protein
MGQIPGDKSDAMARRLGGSLGLNGKLAVSSALSTPRTCPRAHGNGLHCATTFPHRIGNGPITDIGTQADNHSNTSSQIDL